VGEDYSLRAEHPEGIFRFNLLDLAKNNVFPRNIFPFKEAVKI